MTETRHPARRLLGTIIKIVLTLVVVYFLGREVVRHWGDIRDYEWQLDWGYLAASIVVGLLTFFIMAANWRLIMAGFGHRVTAAKSFRIFYLSDLGRYLPGRIWALLGILYLTRQEGIPPERATASFVISQVLAIPASFLVFALASQLEPRILVDQVALLGQGTGYVFTAAMLAVSAAVVLRPQFFMGLANWVLRRFGRTEMRFVLDKKVALRVFAGYAVGWSCYGVAFHLFVKAVAPETALSPVAAVGAFNAAYQIGYLALFAPGGFGPRELVLGFMLTPFLGPVAVAVTMIGRLWVMAVEIVAALIALCIRK